MLQKQEAGLPALPPETRIQRLQVALSGIPMGVGQGWLDLAMSTAASYVVTSCSDLS